ncbi:MAG: LLM class flavin-dependent oxidoreductase [Rhodococcus sp. (in: high G+C Gram-positive bacteria)]
MTRIGVVLRPDLPPETIVDRAREADEAGVDEVWLWEDCFYSGGIATAAVVLASTRGVCVGIGVLPTPLRNIALTAMEIATLARVHPGRLRVGLGHGVQSWMGQVGNRVQSPMTLLREQMGALTSLLAGDTVTVHGRYVDLTDVGLDWPPPQVPPLLIGATGPKTLALSGELAAGTILTSDTDPEQLRVACNHIAGSPKHEIVVYVECTDDDEASAAHLRRWIDAGATTIVLEPAAETTDLTGLFERAVQLRSEFGS